MTSTPAKVVKANGMVGIQVLNGYHPVHWFTPLDAMDLSDDIRLAANQLGKEAVAQARRVRQASA